MNIDQLLHALAEKLHCTYVSDLHAPAMRGRLYSAIKPLIGQYPLSAWNRALSYILGEPVSFQSEKDLELYFQKIDE